MSITSLAWFSGPAFCCSGTQQFNEKLHRTYNWQIYSWEAETWNPGNHAKNKRTNRLLPESNLYYTLHLIEKKNSDYPSRSILYTPWPSMITRILWSMDNTGCDSQFWNPSLVIKLSMHVLASVLSTSRFHNISANLYRGGLFDGSFCQNPLP